MLDPLMVKLEREIAHQLVGQGLVETSETGQDLTGQFRFVPPGKLEIDASIVPVTLDLAALLAALAS